MIIGVETKLLRLIPDERGQLMEILRTDDKMYLKFGQVYVSTAYPEVVKAWHYHKKQTDYLTVLIGMAKIVLYDARPDSSTYGEINEFFVGIHNHILIKIPPLIYHGFKCISTTETMIFNCPTEPFVYDSPDEFRVDPFSPDIPYDWTRKDR